MTETRFTLTRYDPDRPWVLLGRERMSVELADGEDFTAWARDRFPGRLFSAEAYQGDLPAWRPGRT